MPFFLIVSGIYILDLATKMIVRAKMSLGEEIRLLPFFSLTHVDNTGIAFGLFQQFNHVFSVVGILVAGLIGFYGFRMYKEDRFTSLVLAAVLGGALGNLTDRLYYGRVTDFLDFYLGSYHWPAFNVADFAICVGAGLLIWHSFRHRTEP